ncbi:hypothetical protein JCM10213_005070 [Rhodosporidiobolus nylandii]
MASSPPARFEELPDDSAPQRETPAKPPSPAGLAGRADDGALSDAGSDTDDGEDRFEDSVWWTPDELKDILLRAQELKTRGNAEFGQGRWEMALETYKEGLAELPVRTTPHGASVKGKGKEKELPEGEEEAVAEPEPEPEEKDMAELSELRAILSANVAACLLKLERYKDAVKACDDALEEKPDYTKALHRRALANEAIGSWSSLSASLEDFTALSSHAGLSPLLATQIKLARQRLPRKIEVQQEKEKEEVMGKLKDLGNMVLGKFGLSTDNFKFTEQPGGGYGMQFQR